MEIAARRYNGKCPCGSKFSVLATPVDVRGPVSAWAHRHTEFLTDGGSFAAYANDCYRLLYTCRCGKPKTAKVVLGRYRADKKCDGRCLSATGHNCECSCGGKNHGAQS